MSLELLQSSIGCKHTCPIPQLYLRNVHCKCTQITIRYWRTSPKLIQVVFFFCKLDTESSKRAVWPRQMYHEGLRLWVETQLWLNVYTERRTEMRKTCMAGCHQGCPLKQEETARLLQHLWESTTSVEDDLKAVALLTTLNGWSCLSVSTCFDWTLHWALITAV
jgi:hypothetical protein